MLLPRLGVFCLKERGLLSGNNISKSNKVYLVVPILIPQKSLFSPSFFVSLQQKNMGKILVTGGSGYIGSHTVVELQKAGMEVIVADDLSNSKAEVIDRIAEITGKKPIFEKLDFSDAVATRAFFEKEKGIEAIIHFAAAKAVGESVEKPLHYYKNNLQSLLNILENMTIQGIQNIVFSSSCTVYGQPQQLPVDENAPFQKAESPYGNTKKIGEDILADVHKAHCLNIISLRYFNPIGAHESALIGELPNGVPNNLMPFITQTAAGIRPQLQVFGDNYSTPDGTCIRDYIHVVDLAKAHVCAIQRLLNTHGPVDLEFFNIGTGKGYSVLEVIQSFEKTSGQKLNYRIAPRRAGDIEQIWANPHKAENVLGWKAEKTLDDMTASAWKWQLTL